MRLHRNLIWLLFILGSIFLWYGFFRYGLPPQHLLDGMRQELSDGFSWLARLLDRQMQP
jgi:hypothetical protein